MKTPIYETSPGALAALLLTGQFVQCDLHTFNLTGGAGTIRIAAADLDVTYPGGPRWLSTGPRIDPQTNRQLAHWKRGLDVDTWLTVVMPRIVDPITGAMFPDQINGSPWTAAARQGALDGADYQVDRAYFAAWPQPYLPLFSPVGIITIFAGLTAEVDVNDTTVAITSNDYRTLLDTSMPRNLYQAGCSHTLFDAGCSLGALAFKSSGALIAGASRSVLLSAPLAALGSGTFALGSVMMTSGLNKSFSRTVVHWDGLGSLSLLNPLPFAVAVGDTFDVYPGCDKQQATCNRFANIANYLGEDYIPAPETAV